MQVAGKLADSHSRAKRSALWKNPMDILRRFLTLTLKQSRQQVMLSEMVRDQMLIISASTKLA